MSVTSVGLFVAPHATRGVWPTRTKGTPAAPIPVASIGPPFTAIGYHVAGQPSERCGSFAIIGLPLAEGLEEAPRLGLGLRVRRASRPRCQGLRRAARSQGKRRQRRRMVERLEADEV